MPFPYPGIHVSTCPTVLQMCGKFFSPVFWIPLGRSRKAITWHTSSFWGLNFFRNSSNDTDFLWNNCSLYPTYHWIWGPLCQPGSEWSVGEMAPNPIHVTVFCTTFSTNYSKLWFLGSQHNHRSAYRRKVRIRVAFRMNTHGSRTGQREKMSWYVKSGQASADLWGEPMLWCSFRVVLP